MKLELPNQTLVERRRATSVPNADAPDRPRRSVLTFGSPQMRVRILSLLAVGLTLIGCSTIPRPTGIVSVDVKDGRFAEGPYVVKRADFYYLRYRVALEDSRLSLLRVLHARKTRDKAYYCFGIPISHPEWGNVVERPLAYDGFTKFGRQNAVYWLNPDGSEVKLEIREKTEPDGAANGSQPFGSD